MILADTTPSSIAGIFGAVAGTIGALAGLVTAAALLIKGLPDLIRVMRRVENVEAAVQEVHTIVNQQRTDQLLLIAEQAHANKVLRDLLAAHGIEPVENVEAAAADALKATERNGKRLRADGQG